MVFQFLDSTSIGICSRVCKAWRNCANQDSLWFHLFVKENRTLHDLKQVEHGGWKLIFKQWYNNQPIQKVSFPKSVLEFGSRINPVFQSHQSEFKLSSCSIRNELFQFSN
mmetsp:Transcript_14777/g.20602  ORF Transcript_14777/g.20602 Transcript_14777/m.20602 type:complete len:110 (+) Transcript_14777:254-583(+)